MDEYAPPRLGRQLLLLAGLFSVIGLIVAGVVAALPHTPRGLQPAMGSSI